ncbi:hypothetical protein BASA83_008564 [Batrachochytrium salamandrivorans]|nr:hypothetical protein BASA83_008564 [Batrachochytrium salamandrivorans]
MLLTIIVLLALPVLGWFIIIAIGSWPENIGLPNPNSPLNGRKQAVLLVIAHPDDECMFFAPTLLALAATTDRYVLCLSVGNAQGLGRIREKELRASCRILGHSNEIHVESMDHELLPDSMTQDWDLSLIIDTVASHIHKHNIDSIITFDEHGVSGHTNHRAIYKAMRQGKLTGKITIPIYALESVSVLRKFSSLVDVCYTYFSHLFTSNSLTWGEMAVDTSFRRHVFVASIHSYLAGRLAMFEHASQLVWFRYLYLLFSRYMVINTLKRID